MADMLVDGISLFYAMPRGRGNDRDLVLTLFLHGAGGSSQHWEPLLAHLPARFCVLLVDLPGHGRSGGTLTHSIEQTVMLLVHLLDQLGLYQPLWCVGHSMGGLLAQALARRFPERVAGLVLIATATRIRIHADFAQAALSGKWDLEMFRPTFSSQVPRSLQDLVLGEYPKMRVEQGMDFVSLGKTDLSCEVAALTLSVLVIVGDDDVIISPRHSRTMFHALTNAALVVLPRGGHYLQVEQPQWRAQEIDHFVPQTASRLSSWSRYSDETGDLAREDTM
jgi:pimeloyl-ACP methyl ester carboxylesterase